VTGRGSEEVDPTYPELLASHEGDRARLGRHGVPAPVPSPHLEALHLVLHDPGDHGVVAVLLHGHAGLPVQRRAVARQPDAVGERREVVADALVPDAEALQGQRLHHPLQPQHVLGERHDRVAERVDAMRNFT
jgi:hypothetical protein